jgi:hypothetical protein
LANSRTAQEIITPYRYAPSNRDVYFRQFLSSMLHPSA